MRGFELLKTVFPPIVFGALLFLIASAGSMPAQNQKSQRIDLKGCIQTYLDESVVIQDQTAFLKAVRDDKSREWCLKNLEKIDFEKHTLVGIELNTGYCRVPLLDPVQVVKNEPEKQFVVKISYDEPPEPCRALSRYDLWLLVPKLPEKYAVKFEVKGKLFPGRNR